MQAMKERDGAYVPQREGGRWHDAYLGENAVVQAGRGSEKKVPVVAAVLWSMRPGPPPVYKTCQPALRSLFGRFRWAQDSAHLAIRAVK